MPAEFIAEMGSTPEWATMVSVAHTLVYDCMIADATTSASAARSKCRRSYCGFRVSLRKV